MTPAQRIAAERGVTLRTAYNILRRSGVHAAGLGKGRTYDLPDDLRDGLKAARPPRLPMKKDTARVTMGALAQECGVHRSSVLRWLRGECVPAPEFHGIIRDWLLRVEVVTETAEK